MTHRAAPYQQEQQQQYQQPKPQQPQQQLSDEQTVEEFLEQFDINLLEGAKLLVESKLDCHRDFLRKKRLLLSFSSLSNFLDSFFVLGELNDLENESKGDIPILPDFNITTPANKLIVKNLDSFYNPKVIV